MGRSGDKYIEVRVKKVGGKEKKYMLRIRNVNILNPIKKTFGTVTKTQYFLSFGGFVYKYHYGTVPLVASYNPLSLEGDTDLLRGWKSQWPVWGKDKKEKTVMSWETNKQTNKQTNR